MAGAGYNLFVAGQVLTAAQVNTYLMQQSVMQFASAAARTTALSSVLDEGLTTYTEDTNSLGVYSGSAWSTIGPVHGAWTAYTPTWTAAAGSAPAIGNGTIDGAYQRIGRTIHFRARMLPGTTTTFGSAGASNYWRFTVPVATSGTQFAQTVIASYLTVSGGIMNGEATGLVNTSTGYAEFLSLRADSQAWATSYVVLINGTYECGSDA